MTDATSPAPVPASAPQKDHGRAGRNLPAAVASAVVLLGAIALSLLFWKTAFMLIVAAAAVVAVWELGRGFSAKGIDLPEQPLMAGAVVMVVVAYFWGTDALVTATADAMSAYMDRNKSALLGSSVGVGDGSGRRDPED